MLLTLSVGRSKAVTWLVLCPNFFPSSSCHLSFHLSFIPLHSARRQRPARAFEHNHREHPPTLYRLAPTRQTPTSLTMLTELTLTGIVTPMMIMRNRIGNDEDMWLREQKWSGRFIVLRACSFPLCEQPLVTSHFSLYPCEL